MSRARWPIDPDLRVIAKLSATGFPARTGQHTWALRSLANASAGLTWTNPAGVAGNPTPVFANDLGALEALSGTGVIYYRSAADTWSSVTINATLEFTAGTLQRAALSGDVTAAAGSNSVVVKQASQEFALTGIISPAQLTADTNNWAPTNLQTNSVIRFSTDASRSITGIDATGIISGEIKVFHNVGAFDAVFVDESASSTATNRIALPANVTVSGDSGIVLQYDGTSQRWRLFGGAGSGGGGGGAPTSAQYLVLANDATLTQERAFVAGDGISAVDGGAGGNYTVNLDFASQADQETGTSLLTVVTPGRQHFHASAAKAWLRFNAAVTVAASYNITSVTDSGTGDWTVNIATDFSSASYCGVGISPYGASGFGATDQFNLNCDAASAAGTFNVGYFVFQTDSAARADPTSPNEINLAFFGDQ